ncbi:MAG: Bax inhibitor-1/YccA family protein [Actinomycetales bacterium]|nr:Bax inhibitor-1/YccA family protein [Actinomycetales bacterium]
MANPAFRNSPAFNPSSVSAGTVLNGAPVAAQTAVTAEQLQTQYGMPPATPDQMDRMSYEDTIAKAFGAFAILAVGAVIGWFVPVLWIPAALVGFVLAMVNIFKKQPSAALVLAYAAVEGVFVGGISAFYASMWDGIVPMALLGTLGVVGVVLALFTSGKVRASKKATKVFLVLLVGYAAFSLVNLVLMLTGVTTSMYGWRGDLVIPIFGGIPLGIPLGILAVLLGAYSLVMDFEQIKAGVEKGLPRKYGWTGAFGLVLTVVWLYLEILRLLSFFLPRN